ncbi:ArdC family protein [Mucilaginibacter psychrotolerans]|uniref:DUF1738 domain-containing protein n=1 Tax=Mucilaginibacter psychrotolerans TaxID=1524096 RepID=A0A4Y8SC59_9SPHI|nr:zincin-like metallopeptidase domain-containing protein [Mucilaginibacter psychrotolerans]TFF36177.1 DUF1738 domain-containing protein [Mucilaginibacter psychrotolerans]
MPEAIETQPAAEAPKLNVYQMVTNTIIEQLEQGVIPWEKSWASTALNYAMDLPLNGTTEKYYRGINIILLWCSSIKNKFPIQEWAGLRQWNKDDEQVRAGEKGTMIVYYDTFQKEEDGEVKKIPFLKYSYVFNRSQLESFEPAEQEAKPLKKKTKGTKFEPIAEIDTFLENTKAVIEKYDGTPCYNPVSDKILMPFPENFHGTKTATATENYYSTHLHELIHWSGKEGRCDRKFGKKFGDEKYATEELVAEFGAAFLCTGFGLPTVEKGDHSGYISHWLKVLKEDSRIVATAANEASKAVDYLNNLMP